jgi:hypothetical protein
MCIKVANTRSYNKFQLDAAKEVEYHSNRLLTTLKTHVSPLSGYKAVFLQPHQTQTMEYLILMASTVKGCTNIVESFGQIGKLIEATGFAEEWAKCNPSMMEPESPLITAPLEALMVMCTPGLVSQRRKLAPTLKPVTNSLTSELRRVIQEHSLTLTDGNSLYYGSTTAVAEGDLPEMSSIGKPLTEGLMPVQYGTPTLSQTEFIFGFLHANYTILFGIGEMIAAMQEQLDILERDHSIIEAEDPKWVGTRLNVVLCGKKDQVREMEKMPTISPHYNWPDLEKIFTTNDPMGIAPIPFAPRRKPTTLIEANPKAAGLPPGLITDYRVPGRLKGQQYTEDNFVYKSMSTLYDVNMLGNPTGLRSQYADILNENWPPGAIPFELTYDGNRSYADDAFRFTRGRLWLKLIKASDICYTCANFTRAWVGSNLKNCYPLYRALLDNLRLSILQGTGDFLEPQWLVRQLNATMSSEGAALVAKGGYQEAYGISPVWKYNTLINWMNLGAARFHTLPIMMDDLRVKTLTRPEVLDLKNMIAQINDVSK